MFLPVLCCVLMLTKLCLFPATGISLQPGVISRAAASFVPEMQTVANKHLKAAAGKPQTLQGLVWEGGREWCAWQLLGAE